MAGYKIDTTGGGTGVFTIATPNSNTDRTLTLPDEAGTVLTSASDLPAANLTGSLPAGVGGMKLLSSAVVTSSTQWVVFDSTVVTSDYKNYVLVVSDLIPTGGPVHPRIQFSVDNGSTFNVVTIGCRQYNKLGGAGSGHEYTSGGGGEFDVAINLGSGGSSNYWMKLDGLTSSGTQKFFHSNLVGTHNDSSRYRWAGGMNFQSTSAINYIRCGWNSGSTSSGKFYLYGIES